MAITAAPAGANTLTLSVKGGLDIAAGVYEIRAQLKPAPANATILLFAQNPTNPLDITGGAQRDALLALFDKTQMWGQVISVWAEASQAGRTIATSAKAQLKIHVKPLPARITFSVLAAERLTYPGNGHGRTLTKTLINNQWYFRDGSKLESDNTKRGFDCTTFPMSIFNCYPVMSGKFGTALADALGAQKCDLEQLHWTQVRDLFSATGSAFSSMPANHSSAPNFIKRDPFAKATIANSFDRSGVYFVWSAGHVVLYQDGMIHEFAEGGYKVTPAQLRNWSNAPQGLWWIRRLPPHLRA
jgi:hypothetical protein